MHRRGLVLFFVLFVPLAAGCGSAHQAPPSQEQIKRQVERDAAMRAAEDQAERQDKK
jgi:hypothetical protein